MPRETPPWRVKNPWATPSIAARLDAETFILSAVTMAGTLGELTVSEGRRRGKPAARQCQRFEQDSHLRGVGEPRSSRQDRRPLLRTRRFEQSIAPLAKTKSQQELALRHGTIGLQTERFAGALQRGEIDMGGEIGVALQSERVGVAMAAHGLQRIAGAALAVSIVDD